MPDKPGGEKVAGRKEIHPGIIVDQINKELGRQRDFGRVWGSLVSPDYPKTPEETLAARRAELAAIEAKGLAAPTATTTSRAEFSNTKSLETGLGKCYKALKAGV
jgi:hypothetical protein